MDYIKISKVDNVTLHRRGASSKGTLHLTTHHIIFTVDAGECKALRELWICYPMIDRADFKLGSSLLFAEFEEAHPQQSPGSSHVIDKTLFEGANLRIRCRDFNYIAFDFPDKFQGYEAFESLMQLTCLDDVEKLYAFIYKPVKIEQPLNGWKIYNPIKEFERQGIQLNSDRWRVSDINSDYKFCSSYPAKLVVPTGISDSVLNHASRFRSKARVPVLTYFYKDTQTCVLRCSQPLTGIKQSRSIQDESLIDMVFKSYSEENRQNMIVDARPLANAMAQTALGAGTEIMDNYKNCRRVFLGLDNIHVIRESLIKLTDELKDGDVSRRSPNVEILEKSSWLRHIRNILEGTELLVKFVFLNKSHLVVHCSDGWDRTSQLVSLLQLCLDPYFRTLQGFIILIEKEWLSFGHRFNERCGFLQSETRFTNNTDIRKSTTSQAFKSFSNHFKHRKHIKYTSPVFQQFLDCIYQLLRQNPSKFEFNERFLRRLVYHLYSCQYGTFLYDSEHERESAKAFERTRSVWDYFNARHDEFKNSDYDSSCTQVIFPKIDDVKYWHQLFGRGDSEMNKE